MNYEIGTRISNNCYKSMYPISRSGELIAFLTIQHGWGRMWHISPLRIAPDHSRIEYLGMQPDDKYKAYCSGKDNVLKDLETDISLFPTRYKTRTELLAALQVMKEAQLANEKLRLVNLQNEHKKLGEEVNAISFTIEIITKRDLYKHLEEIDNLRNIRNRLVSQAAATRKSIEIQTIRTGSLP